MSDIPRNPMGDAQQRNVRARSSDSPKGALLFLLLPAVCCGLPFFVAALATASLFIKGVVAGVVVALIGVIATFLVRRHLRAGSACALPARDAESSPNNRGGDGA